MPEFAQLHTVDELDEINQDAGWETEYCQLCPGSFHAQFWLGSTAIFDFTRESLTGSLEVRGADRDDVVSLFIRRPSSGELRFNGYHMDCGDQFMLMPGSEVRAHVKSNAFLDSLSIPVSRVADVANAFDLEWRGHIPGPSRKLRLPHEAVDGFTQAVDAALFGGSAERVSSEANSAQALELFVRAVLSPVDGQTTQKQRPRLGNHRKFKNALEFIEANLAGEITVAEVCQHADVGIRTLERHFARETGVQPSAYIKARRLNKTRRSLLAAVPAETHVTRVAAEHGITHLGRFSGEYRRFFGELPSETLTRPR